MAISGPGSRGLRGDPYWSGTGYLMELVPDLLGGEVAK